MDARRVGGPAHQPIQRINLAHKVALADPADRRIAGHLTDRLDAVRQQQGLCPDARGGRGRFAPGMTAAHNHDIEAFNRHCHTLLHAGRVAL